MSQSPSVSERLASVSLVVVDHYLAPPLPGLDPLVADFRGGHVTRVPILRIFGSTPAGQRTCLHVHGIFPYLYVPLPSDAEDSFLYRLASSLDKAINISLQQGSSGVQHVYKAVKVSGRPMYGFHPRQHNFVKIFFYSPAMVKRAADLLAGGAVMNQLLQPHESHINAVLQFMMDYNLQGMNYIHLRHMVFRRGALHDEYDDIEPFTDLKRSYRAPVACSSNLENYIEARMSEAASERIFHEDEMPESLLLPHSVLRQSSSQLEMDAVAADILNYNDLSEGGMNPGLKALWQEEKERRADLQIPDDLAPPDSPTRPKEASESSASERFWLERLSQIIEQERADSADITVSGDSADPDSTMNMSRTLESSRGGGHPRVFPGESSDVEERSLPSATERELHVASLSETVIDSTELELTNLNSTELLPDTGEMEEESLGDVTVVDESVIASQMSQSCLEEEDRELADLLTELATDVGDTPPSQRTSHRSQNSLSQTPASARKTVEDQDDEDESLEMSQAVWMTDPHQREEDSDEDWSSLDRTMMEQLAREIDSD